MIDSLGRSNRSSLFPNQLCFQLFGPLAANCSKCQSVTFTRPHKPSNIYQCRTLDIRGMALVVWAHWAVAGADMHVLIFRRQTAKKACQI